MAATTAPIRRGRLEGTELVTLAAGELEASFAPHLGMAGVSLLHRGVELLDRREGLAAYAKHGAVMGIPLLHPWANRLDAHGYTLEDREIRLPSGPPLVRCEEHGLPIHGLLNAWPHWAVTSDGTAPALAATLDFAAHRELLDAFPFPHELSLEVRLDPEGLEIATGLRATGEHAVPVSFGFHPYLRLPETDRATWRVTLPPRRHLATDTRGIPTDRTLLEPAESFTLGDRSYDDGYDGLRDGACFSVDDGDRTITLTLSRGFPAAQIFSPPRAQFVCFEPMTAPTNALRSGRGLRRVEPGEEFEAVFRIGVT